MYIRIAVHSVVTLTHAFEGECTSYRALCGTSVGPRPLDVFVDCPRACGFIAVPLPTPFSFSSRSGRMDAICTS